jgi:uncharacterized membrane protein
VATISTPDRRPWIFALFLIIVGVLGWWASFSLTIDRFLLLENPDSDLDCNFTLLVQCGENLRSPQGSAFGFPNSLLGLGGFAAPIAVGVSLLAGARFARWFWIVFNAGIAGALAFDIWLIGQSIFVLGTLCPWCMLVWGIVIPLFWVVTFRNLGAGVFREPPRRLGKSLLSWVVPITVACYVVVALLAQFRLNVLGYL